MKPYVTPSLRALGPLRVVTKISGGDPVQTPSSGSYGSSGSSGDSENGHWSGHGHGSGGELI